MVGGLVFGLQRRMLVRGSRKRVGDAERYPSERYDGVLLLAGRIVELDWAVDVRKVSS